MATLEETLQTVLSSTGTTTYLFNKPQGIKLPKIVYQRISKVPSRSMTGRGLDKDRFQITVWSTTYAEGRTITDSVINKIDLNKTDFILSYLDNEIDNKEVETNLYQFILDIFIFSKPY